MISRMDRDIGSMMKLLDELGLEEDTLILFSSDNGATYLKGPDTDFFNSCGGLRGKKGSLYEGGIRVPTIAHWKGKIQPGTESDHATAFWDIMPTFAQITGANTADDTDGISFAPTLFGNGNQKPHDYLYWEFPSYGGQQAVQMGDWKGIRQNLMRKEGDQSWQLYNLKTDRNETTDVAKGHPEIINKIKKIAASARVPSEQFPFPALDG
jgi:arylsulfatase